MHHTLDHILIGHKWLQSHPPALPPQSVRKELGFNAPNITAQRPSLSDAGVSTIQVQRCLMASLCDRGGNEGRPGAALHREALKDSKFPPESSRVRRLPVARLLSGSNHILKGFLTRNTHKKKKYCTCSFGGGGRFSGVVLEALCLWIKTGQESQGNLQKEFFFFFLQFSSVVFYYNKVCKI